MTNALSKSRIDRLGEVLRTGDASEDDLRLLDEWRRSFSDAYEVVVGAVRDRLGLAPTGRPAKSTTSIVEKLRRESIRLSQMQDIAGCRVIVEYVSAQDLAARRIAEIFDETTIVDRRLQPSHGYRAVHALVKIDNRVIEVQVRTTLQHVWAEVSEKISDSVDPGIKYGRGDVSILSILERISSLYAQADSMGDQLLRAVQAVPDGAEFPQELAVKRATFWQRLETDKVEVARLGAELVTLLAHRGGR